MFANPDIHSNKQIQSLDNDHINLLNSFIKKHGIKKNVDKKLTDLENFKILKTYNPMGPTELYSSREIFFEIERAKNRAAEIYEYINEYCPNFIKNIKDKKEIKILDIGSGNGLIAKHLALLFKCNVDLDMIDIYVKEIHVPYEPINSRFMKNYNSFDIENKKYDLILFITSAHHILNFPEVLHKCVNKLSKNGIIIFREHRPKNNQDKIFLDLCDHLWEFVFTNENKITLKNYKNSIPSKYFFPNHINKLIYDDGLELLPDKKIKNYEINGFISYFAALFSKAQGI